MLLTLSLIIGQFIPQDANFMNLAYSIQDDLNASRAYEQKTESSDEKDESKGGSNEDEEIILLSNNKNSSGKFLNVSCKKDKEPEEGKNKKDEKDDVKDEEDSGAKTSEEGTIKTASYDDETADKHLQQLAYTIADDLGIITKVSINR